MKRFFWKVYGIEPSLVQDCTTDHQFYVGQGLLLSMTTLFAFVSGSRAGYAFANNQWGWGAVAFGVIWMLLIYSLDRAMIHTIDKVSFASLDPFVRFLKGILIYLFPRAVLGGLLALIMSVPFEIWILQDEIAKQADQKYYSAITDLSNAAHDEADNWEKNLPAAREANIVQTDSINMVNKLTRLKTDLIQADGLSQKLHKNYLDYRKSNTHTDYLQHHRTDPIAESKYTACQHQESEVNKINKDIKTTQEAIEDISKKKNDLTHQAFDSTQKQLPKKTIDFSHYTRNGLASQILILLHFDDKNPTKEKDPTKKQDPSIGKIIWALRIAFFIIEILPTLLKLIGKPREYDQRVEEVAQTNARIRRQTEWIREQKEIKKYKYKY